MEMRKLGIEALPRPLKKLIKFLIPDTFVVKRRNRKLNSFSGRSNREIFTSTYRNYLWGRKNGEFSFYSGDGSHAIEIVEDYVSSVAKFLFNLPEQPVIVDLGCGDFNIGGQLAKYAKEYVACDVVPEIIEANVRRNILTNVTFKIIDAASDELPKGDIVILRQVLQHLSNQDTLNVIKGIQHKYKYLIFTDHQPFGANWTPNLDKLTGPNIRLENNSGIDLKQPPFNLQYLSREVISEIEVSDGFIRTFIYQMN